MKRAIAIVICTVFLVSGLIRIGVGGLMMGQTTGWWTLDGEAAETLVETQQFIAAHDANLVGFTPFAYFGFILFMGLTISLGAIGQFWRRSWGLALIGVYLLSHAFLFVNFLTINPKVVLLIAATVLAGVLRWANQPDEATGDVDAGVETAT